MPKEVVAKVKLQVPGAQATPAPPVGTALGPHQINIGDFVRRFNDATKNSPGVITPVVITIYRDRTFDFITKTPPASFLLKQAAGIIKGSAEPNKEKVGTVTKDQVRQIAEQKMEDLSASDIDMAIRIIEGSARSMGITVQ